MADFEFPSKFILFGEVEYEDFRKKHDRGKQFLIWTLKRLKLRKN